MDTISQIKAKLDIVDLINSYTPIKKTGTTYKGVCPFHSENTPSFAVSQDLQIYKCFGCGKGGDIFSFVQEIEGIEFGEALKKLAEKAGIELSKEYESPQNKVKGVLYEINKNTADLYQGLLKHKVGVEALKYLKESRKLKDETIADFKLGYAPQSWDIAYQFLKKKGFTDLEIEQSGVCIKKRDGAGYIDKFRDRVIFPFIDVDKKIVGFIGRSLHGQDPKYLNTAETPLFHKTSFVYGLDKAKIEVKKKGAIFVEGQMDLIKAHQFGFKNIIATTGTALTNTHLQIIDRYTKSLTFCFDSDTAGIAAIYRAIEKAENLNFDIQIATIPKPYKDLDEYIDAEPEKAKILFDNATNAYDFFIANSLKNHNRNDPNGKNKILAELSETIGKISNEIVFSEYSKKLSEELNIEETLVRKYLTKEQKMEVSDNSVPANIQNEYNPVENSEDYLLSLLLRAKLDIIRRFLYKVEDTDFYSQNNREIFKQLKTVADSKSSNLDMKLFLLGLSTELKTKAEELYLWDSKEEHLEEAKIEKELNEATLRLKLISIERELKICTDKIKLAEMEGNTEDLKIYTQRALELSKQKRETLNYV